MDEKSDVLSGIRDDDLKVIRENMDETKKDLASTLQDLRERYSPERMKKTARATADDLGDRASEILQKRTEDLKKVADRIGKTIRNNPVPFAAAGAAGIGISAWALLKRESESQPSQYSSPEEQASIAGYYADSPESGEEFLCDADISRGDVAGKAAQVAQKIGDSAKKLGENARLRTEQLGSNFVQMVKDHPWFTGAASFCLGVLGGLIFPSTRSEDRVLGSAREKVRQKAQEIKEEARESAQRVVEETKRVAEEEARKHGLTLDV